MDQNRTQNSVISKDTLMSYWEGDISRLIFINNQDDIILQQSWADKKEFLQNCTAFDTVEGQGKGNKTSRQKIKNSEHLKDNLFHFNQNTD